MRLILNCIAAAALTWGVLTPAWSQKYGGGMSEASSGKNLGASDKKFVDEAAQGGIAEVELGNFAKDKASDPSVRDFAQRMVTDHTKSNDDLKKTAEKLGVTLPTEPSAKQMEEKEKLSNLSGSAFDKDYISYELSDHRKDVAEFKRESTSAVDPEVKAFASRTLPTLKEHLALAEKANAKVNGSGSSASIR